MSPRQQICALCWRRKAGAVQVLLITSRETGRWVLPKGWPIKGMIDARSAAQEAWEEAGVTGITGAIVGRYGYFKVVGRDTPRERHIPCAVDVYELQVRDLAKRYPEVKQRRRKWFSPQDAAKLVDEAELRDILHTFTPAG